MFGLIRPYFKKMIKEDKCEYRCYYCGLCMGMGRNTGLLSRFLLSYEVCMAYLVADSVCMDTEVKTARCPFSGFKRVRYRDNPELLNKLASINYILVYHKQIDDIDDDNSLAAKIVERLMRKRYIGIKKANEPTVQAVTQGLEVIRTAEASNERISLRDAAEPLGELLEGAMKGCLNDPMDDRIFSALCKYLGMWIYVIDACVDLEKDIKRNRYNPLKVGRPKASAEDIIAAEKEEIIEFLMSCKQSMQQLLELLSCGKNENLVHDLFEYLLPRDVADMLR